MKISPRDYESIELHVISKLVHVKSLDALQSKKKDDITTQHNANGAFDEQLKRYDSKMEVEVEELVFHSNASLSYFESLWPLFSSLITIASVSLATSTFPQHDVIKVNKWQWIIF